MNLISWAADINLFLSSHKSEGLSDKSIGQDLPPRRIGITDLNMQLLQVIFKLYKRLPTILSTACNVATAIATKVGLGRAPVTAWVYYHWQHYL